MFIFRRIFRLGPFRIGVGKRGISSIGIGRFTKSRGRSTRVTIPTGIKGCRSRSGARRSDGGDVTLRAA